MVVNQNICGQSWFWRQRVQYTSEKHRGAELLLFGLDTIDGYRTKAVKYCQCHIRSMVIFPATNYISLWQRNVCEQLNHSHWNGTKTQTITPPYHVSVLHCIKTTYFLFYTPQQIICLQPVNGTYSISQHPIFPFHFTRVYLVLFFISTPYQFTTFHQNQITSKCRCAITNISRQTSIHPPVKASKSITPKSSKESNI